jgi:hypothetical protein
MMCGSLAQVHQSTGVIDRVGPLTLPLPGTPAQGDGRDGLMLVILADPCPAMQ